MSFMLDQRASVVLVAWYACCTVVGMQSNYVALGFIALLFVFMLWRVFGRRAR